MYLTSKILILLLIKAANCEIEKLLMFFIVCLDNPDLNWGYFFICN